MILVLAAAMQVTTTTSTAASIIQRHSDGQKYWPWDTRSDSTPSNYHNDNKGMRSVAVKSSSSSSRCKGNNKSECMNRENYINEIETMDLSEIISRRTLGQGDQYISYAALSKDSIPCNRRGSSYYSNCAHSQQANPYTRGCTAITQCARR